MTIASRGAARFAAGVSALAIAGAVWTQGAVAQSVPALTSQVQVSAAAQSAFRNALAEAAVADEAVAGFYRDRAYAPFWTGPEDAPRRAALLQALAGAGMHGLPVGRYDPADLIAAFRAARTEGDRGRLEVRMTLALLDYARDVQTGALVPSKVAPGIVREVPVRDRRGNLDGFARAADPLAFLTSLPPRSQEYVRLMKARFMLERAAAEGSWGAPVSAKSLEPGATGEALIALRDRLAAMGYLPGNAAAASYDDTIRKAVSAFQADHGIEVNGVAGATTLAEINVGPERRLAAVIVAMERERWLNIERGKRHIWVNLADFSAQIVDDGRVTFQTRAVVGAQKIDKNTPEFSHKMTYMELNPDWTVPGGIIKRDYLPKLKANPNALGHLQLIDRRGRVVPRGSVDFAAYSASNFPFNLRQAPGDGNALGRVKFMFPNPHAIYLHDTPEKHLFGREVRTYSSGCVRLNDPFEFAYELLSRQEADPRTAFHKVLDTRRQERIFLKEPVPIHLEYRTAFSNPRGQMQYRRDMYGRDAAIFRALVQAGVVTAAADS
ncbi:MAG: L,D-transpeptidase family protein [Paracoccaceae bacterium]|nr:MAG: L,D-transpeptidase family protein [Paracoccaceae bacterium]